jgi:threonine 3-dehydrogenase
LRLARKLGASLALDVRTESLDVAMKSLHMEEGFDVGLEMSGVSTAFQDMLRSMRHGGNVALLGLMPNDTGICWEDVIFKGLLMKGVYGREMFETWYKMVSMLQSGLDISAVITHRLPAEEYQYGFETMASGQSGKVILDWNISP